jgi:hypothetical protein
MGRCLSVVEAVRGFTLAEAVVALGLVVALVSGLAGVWTMAARATVGARQRTLAIALARDKVEQLASLTWSVRAVAGVDVLVEDSSTDLSQRPAVSGGFGTRASPADTLAVSRATYADYLDAQGQWVGAGAAVVPGARYVRRWHVARTGAGSTEMLVFEVMVANVMMAANPPTGAWWRQHPDAVWLCGAKLRRRVG